MLVAVQSNHLADMVQLVEFMCAFVKPVEGQNARLRQAGEIDSL